MRVIFQDEEMLDGEIVLDEIYIQLVGRRDEETMVNDETIKGMIGKMQNP